VSGPTPSEWQGVPQYAPHDSDCGGAMRTGDHWSFNPPPWMSAVPLPVSHRKPGTPASFTDLEDLRLCPFFQAEWHENLRN
jgi:rubredoxin